MRKRMDRIIYTLLAIIIIMPIIGLSIFIINDINRYTSDHGIPEYFLEPDGYVIAEITYFRFDENKTATAYGYLLSEDYEVYKNHTLTKQVIKLLNPYNEEKRPIAIVVSSIRTITIGKYIDKRYELLKEEKKNETVYETL